MAEIEVTRSGGDWLVAVREAGRRSEHRVSVSPEEAERFGGGAATERLLEESFRFLLEREPASSILRRFALSAIADYFPEYPAEIRRRLDR
jgi:hypothetical protein